MNRRWRHSNTLNTVITDSPFTMKQQLTWYKKTQWLLVQILSKLSGKNIGTQGYALKMINNELDKVNIPHHVINVIAFVWGKITLQHFQITKNYKWCKWQIQAWQWDVLQITILQIGCVTLKVAIPIYII